MRVSKVGRYTLIAELAQGGMGTVHLGVVRGPAGFSKLMVIKQLRRELAEDPIFLNMFLEEARLAARLNHPNVVQTTEVGSEQGVHFLAMEFLDGQSLQRVRTRIGRGDQGSRELPLPLHVRVLAETLHGLHYAHELREIDGTPLHIVHRDVSPHNVFVTYDGQVKVVDFGIAKAVDSSLETRTGELKGKVAYMPPEQAAMQKVDRRADVFAVGVMLWEAIAQRRMWHGLNEMAILHRLMTGDLPPIRSACPAIDAELESIVMRAISPSPDMRPSSAEQMALELEGWLARTGQNPSPRDIGRLLSEVFTQDREELAKVIEQQLRILRELPDSSAPSTYEPIDLTRMHLAGGATPAPSMQTRSAFSGPAVAPAPGPERPFPVVLALGVMAALVLLSGAIFALAFRSPTPNVVTAPPPPLPVTTPSAVPATSALEPEARVTLTLEAEPASARFFVDDTPVEGNPYIGPYKRDGLTHKIRVEAPGFDTERFSLVFDKDLAHKSTLHKHAPIVHHTTPPPSVTPEAATAGKKPPREIETAYPPR